MKRLILAVIFILVMAVTAQAATNVSFTWGVVPSDCATVKVYQSATSGVYTYTEANVKVAVVGSTRAATINGVADGTWFWVGTCSDNSGNQSGPSAQATATFDSTAPNAPPDFKISLTANINVTVNP